MDILLSLPIVSYFLAPAMTSWSTSLNLLFFYMTWSTLVLSHPPLKIQLIGALFLRTVLWLLPSTLFLLFDFSLPSLAESIKIGGASALPPQRISQLAKPYGLALLNLLLGVGLECGSSLAYAYFAGAPLFKTSTTLPLPWQMIKHVILLISAREVFTYYIHRYLLHSSGYMAKLHQQYDHARSKPAFSLALATDHPLPYLLHRIVPAFLPAWLLRPHLLVYFFFIALCTVEETFAQSGYSVVPGIIMGGMTRRTATHYASGGKGNYGAWGLLDWVNGTSKGQDAIEDVKQEAEKHRVKQRGGKAAGDAMGMLNDGIEGFRKGRRSTRQKKNRSQ